jgi:glycosyltransferase involved in cell wall biosynthesis
MYPTSAAPTAGTFVERQVLGLERTGVTVDVLHVERSVRGVRQYWGAGRRAAREISRVQPDVIHVMQGGLLSLQMSRVPRRCGLVISFGGSDLLGSPAGPPFLALRGAFGVWCSRLSAVRADHVIVKSAQLAAVLSGRVPPELVSIIPNGVDLERFRPLEAGECRRVLGWPEGRMHVLIAGHDARDQHKGVPVAEAAVAQLVGSGIPADLHVMYRTPHRDVPTWLNASDVVLVASRHEGSPNIVKEALACDRPVVSVDVGDVKERLADIEGCHLVGNDVGSIAAALRRVHDGPRAVAARGRMADLSVERVASRLAEVYDLARRHWDDRRGGAQAPR